MTMFSSRPPFNYRPQHNPTNSILDDSRAARADALRRHPGGYAYVNMLAAFNMCVDSSGHFITSDWERITDADQIDHTRRVLTRLANLEKMSS